MDSPYLVFKFRFLRDYLRVKKLRDSNRGFCIRILQHLAPQETPSTYLEILMERSVSLVAVLGPVFLHPMMVDADYRSPHPTVTSI